MGCGFCQASLSGLISGIGFLGLFTLSLIVQLLVALISWARQVFIKS